MVLTLLLNRNDSPRQMPFAQLKQLSRFFLQRPKRHSNSARHRRRNRPFSSREEFARAVDAGSRFNPNLTGKQSAPGSAGAAWSAFADQIHRFRS